jgi:soluble lytic murein transglycosylase-like protein
MRSPKVLLLSAILSSVIFFVVTSFVTEENIEKENFSIEKARNEIGKELQGKVEYKTQAPPCIELHNSLEKYTAEYKIPTKIAYRIAFSETRYQGPLHWNYDHQKTSSAGALGPMQVMYSTAKSMFPNETFTPTELKNDIDFNVHCSMKLLRKLMDRYGNWKIVLGAYSTGRPCINGYSEKICNNL